MKGRSLLLSAILFLAAGLILILTYKTTRTAGIVMVGGVLFIVCGLLNIFTYLADKPGKKEIQAALKEGLKPRTRSSIRSALVWISSGAAVILGVCMLVFTGTFIPLVPPVFALLIALGALYQFYLLAAGCRPLRLPAWLLTVPVLLTVAAVYVFLQKAGDDKGEHLIMLITGISFVLFAAAMITESVMIGTANRKLAAAAKAGTPAIVTDNPPTAATDSPKSLDDSAEDASVR